MPEPMHTPHSAPGMSLEWKMESQPRQSVDQRAPSRPSTRDGMSGPGYPMHDANSHPPRQVYSFVPSPSMRRPYDDERPMDRGPPLSHPERGMPGPPQYRMVYERHGPHGGRMSPTSSYGSQPGSYNGPPHPTYTTSPTQSYRQPAPGYDGQMNHYNTPHPNHPPPPHSHPSLGERQPSRHGHSPPRSVSYSTSQIPPFGSKTSQSSLPPFGTKTPYPSQPFSGGHQGGPERTLSAADSHSSNKDLPFFKGTKSTPAPPSPSSQQSNHPPPTPTLPPFGSKNSGSRPSWPQGQRES